MRIRQATQDDEAFIASLAAEAFASFGDYGPLLPQWLKMPGVLTYLGEVEQQRAGFVMLAFFREETPQALVGDVLAIAVDPARQGQGLGRELLEHAITSCLQVGERVSVRAIRLSVADTNARARRLFASCGFRELAGDFGRYAGGQQALHMERPLPIHPPAG